MYVAGIDIGSTITKVIILRGLDIVAQIIRPSGPQHRRLANVAIEKGLAEADIDLSEVDYIVATGYGRINVPFADKQVTEIACHAKGISHLFPSCHTIIDIGGQDSKGIKVSHGKVLGFVMNDKCAAGTGRFLEVIAEALGVKIEQIGGLSLQANSLPRISSVCTVYAELEVINLMAEGAKLTDVLAGLHDSIAVRIVGMVKRLTMEKDIVVTGGGAKNIGLVKALENNLETKVLLPPEPLITGALGAALLGYDLATKAKNEGGLPKKIERHLEEATFNKEGD